MRFIESEYGVRKKELVWVATGVFSFVLFVTYVLSFVMRPSSFVLLKLSLFSSVV